MMRTAFALLVPLLMCTAAHGQITPGKQETLQETLEVSAGSAMAVRVMQRREVSNPPAPAPSADAPPGWHCTAPYPLTCTRMAP